jgi:hypothetical protein
VWLIDNILLIQLLLCSLLFNIPLCEQKPQFNIIPLGPVQYINQSIVPNDTEYIIEKIKKAFPEEPEKAVSVALCESTLDPTIVNNNPDTYDYSVGLFQINLFGELAKNRPSEEWLKDPDNNIAYARKMYLKEGWTPWSCSRQIAMR